MHDRVLAGVEKLVVSDVHLAPDTAATQDALVSAIDAFRGSHLVLLGDIFHFWWGFPGVIPAWTAPFIAALSRAAQAGMKLTWVPGNHDFALGPVLREEVGVEVVEELRFGWAGEAYLMRHGDEADQSLGYRVTRRVLRGAAFAGLMTALGPRGAPRLGFALAGASHRMGERREDDHLVQDQRALARTLLADGADVVVFGHSHRREDLSFKEGRYINLGAFSVGSPVLAFKPGEPAKFVALSGVGAPGPG